MKKLILISLLMLVLSLTAMAADVNVTVSSDTALVGEEVSLTFSVKSEVKMNSIAFTGFEYDSNALEFVGFEACEGLSSLTQLPAHFDKNNMAVVIGLKTAIYDTELFTATFKVKDAVGEVTVSAKVITKNSSTPLTNSITPGVISTAYVTQKGTSLVLDGAIGVRTYFGISDLISSFEAEVEVYDTDMGVLLSSDTVVPEYDSDKGSYYTVVYVSPKDADNREIRITLKYLQDGKEVTLDTETVTINGYIDAFKELAENKPDSEYGKALDLVETMESYTKYADSFFGNGDDLEDVSTDTEAIAKIEEPVNEGTLSNVELFATSLVLEDKTTIRHYFKYSGDYTEHTFKVGDKTLAPKVKGDLIYVDIENVVAQDMDKVYTLTVSDEISVSYSVLNYVKQAVDSSDKKLSNLVKALYNYYVQAESYAK